MALKGNILVLSCLKSQNRSSRVAFPRASWHDTRRVTVCLLPHSLVFGEQCLYTRVYTYSVRTVAQTLIQVPKGELVKIDPTDRTPRETLEERLEKTPSNARCFAQGSPLVC